MASSSSLPTTTTNTTGGRPPSRLGRRVIVPGRTFMPAENGRSTAPNLSPTTTTTTTTTTAEEGRRQFVPALDDTIGFSFGQQQQQDKKKTTKVTDLVSFETMNGPECRLPTNYLNRKNKDHNNNNNNNSSRTMSTTTNMQIPALKDTTSKVGTHRGSERPLELAQRLQGRVGGGKDRRSRPNHIATFLHSSSPTPTKTTGTKGTSSRISNTTTDGKLYDTQVTISARVMGVTSTPSYHNKTVASSPSASLSSTRNNAAASSTAAVRSSTTNRRYPMNDQPTDSLGRIHTFPDEYNTTNNNDTRPRRKKKKKKDDRHEEDRREGTTTSRKQKKITDLLGNALNRTVCVLSDQSDPEGDDDENNEEEDKGHSSPQRTTREGQSNIAIDTNDNSMQRLASSPSSSLSTIASTTTASVTTSNSMTSDDNHGDSGFHTRNNRIQSIDMEKSCEKKESPSSTSPRMLYDQPIPRKKRSSQNSHCEDDLEYSSSNMLYDTATTRAEKWYGRHEEEERQRHKRPRHSTTSISSSQSPPIPTSFSTKVPQERPKQRPPPKERQPELAIPVAYSISSRSGTTLQAAIDIPDDDDNNDDGNDNDGDKVRLSNTTNDDETQTITALGKRKRIHGSMESNSDEEGREGSGERRGLGQSEEEGESRAQQQTTASPFLKIMKGVKEQITKVASHVARPFRPKPTDELPADLKASGPHDKNKTLLATSRAPFQCEPIVGNRRRRHDDDSNHGFQSTSSEDEEDVVVEDDGRNGVNEKIKPLFHRNDEETNMEQHHIMMRTTDGSERLRQSMEDLSEPHPGVNAPQLMGTATSTTRTHHASSITTSTRTTTGRSSLFNITKCNHKISTVGSTNPESRSNLPSRKKGIPIVAGAAIKKASQSSETLPCAIPRPWRKRGDDDSDGDYDPNQEKRRSLSPLKQERRRSRRLSSSSKIRPIHKSPEVVDICDSESEIEEVGPPEPMAIDLELTRMAVGNKVYHAECHASLDPQRMELELKYKKTRRTVTRTRTDDDSGYNNILLTLRDGTFLRYLVWDGGDEKNEPAKNKNNQDNEKDDEAHQLGPFVALHIIPTLENGLEYYRRQLDPESNEVSMRYVVLELRETDDLNRIIEVLSRLDVVRRIPAKPKNVRKYASSLLAPQNRKRVTKRNAFLDGRPLDYALMVYPFPGKTTEIEAAAAGLNEAAGTMKSVSEISKEEETCEAEDDGEGKSRHRAHFVTISVEDYDRLDPGEWLNDSLVDFWMQWISRDNTTLDSSFHFFSSHFYSRLAAEGPDSVAGWTRRKNINIFTKKLIFVPINKSMHWSLCVVVNPGALVESWEREPTKKDPLSCMIFMDSLRMHNKSTVANHVRKWLNSEYNRMAGEKVTTGERIAKEDVFIPDKFPIFCPRVPLQNNTWDCGVFVCRYAYAIYELRDRDFTYGDAGMHCEETDIISGSSSRAFQELISDGAEFDFDMADIARFREEFKTLIIQLSRLYAKAKSAEKQAIFEEKMKRHAVAANDVLTHEKEDEAMTSLRAPMGSQSFDSGDDSRVEILPQLDLSVPTVVVPNEKENLEAYEMEKDSKASERFNGSIKVREKLATYNVPQQPAVQSCPSYTDSLEV